MDKIDRLLVLRSALKGIVTESEDLLGIDGALPVSMAALQGIDAIDREVARLRGVAA